MSKDGKGNTGEKNTGRNNSGDGNSGSRNSGDWNSGYGNSGSWNSGNWNSGDRNLGDRNSGSRNPGDWNSGNGNPGDCNSGYWNSGDWNSGWFNTDEPTARFFNQDTNIKLSDFYSSNKCPGWNEFYLTKWIDEKDMTDEEKKADPEFYVRGGQLKTYTYKEAWANFWRDTSEENRQKFLDLPNFNPDIFKEITGIYVGRDKAKKEELLKKADELLEKVEELKKQANEL
jgi:hypothetical protein